MRLYRRSGSPRWWFDFSVAGHRIRASTGTEARDEAEIIAAQVRRDALLGVRTGQKPRLTLSDAAGRYWIEHGAYVRSPRALASRIKRLLASVGKHVFLDYVDDDLLSRIVAKRRGQVGNSTVNRELAILRAIMNRAKTLWSVETGHVTWRRHRLPEPDHRTRVLTPQDARRLIDAAAPHLRPIITAALFTGLRRGNLLGLDWSQIDMRARLITVRTKSKRPGGKVLTVPIAEPLVVTFGNLGAGERGPVFTFKGRRIGDVKTGFRAAARRAGITDFRFHDLRHTAASWMVDQGVPLDVVQMILGHSDIRLTQRYAHRRQEAQREAVDAIGRKWGADGTFSAQSATERRLKL